MALCGWSQVISTAGAAVIDRLEADVGQLRPWCPGCLWTDSCFPGSLCTPLPAVQPGLVLPWRALSSYSWWSPPPSGGLFSGEECTHSGQGTARAALGPGSICLPLGMAVSCSMGTPKGQPPSIWKAFSWYRGLLQIHQKYILGRNCTWISKILTQRKFTLHSHESSETPVYRGTLEPWALGGKDGQDPSGAAAGRELV